jgi:hypothetical protein
VVKYGITVVVYIQTRHTGINYRIAMIGIDSWTLNRKPNRQKCTRGHRDFFKTAPAGLIQEIEIGGGETDVFVNHERNLCTFSLDACVQSRRASDPRCGTNTEAAQAKTARSPR